MPSTVREYVATDLCEMAMAGKKIMPWSSDVTAQDKREPGKNCELR